MRFRKIFRTAAILLLIQFGTGSALAAVALLTVPNDATNRDGNFFNPIPFGYDDFCDDGARYQQVMLGSEIGSGRIDSIRFRLDGGEFSGTGPVSYGGVTITLSSTFAAPFTLSRRFSDNVGPDATLVFSGDFTTESDITMGNQHPFGFTIPINAPFEFDGNQANLLLDITITDCYSGPTFLLDAEIGPTMGRQFARDKDDEMGLPPIEVNIGLVTEITLSSPPPATFVQGLGGNWEIVGHTGEGFMIDVLADGRMVLFWFTFDLNGTQVWLVSSNFLVGNEAAFDMNFITGPVFGPGFDPNAVIDLDWGTVVITFFDCNTGQVTFISTMGFGSGTYQIQRVYTTEQSSCLA